MILNADLGGYQLEYAHTVGSDGKVADVCFTGFLGNATLITNGSDRTAEISNSVCIRDSYTGKTTGQFVYHTSIRTTDYKLRDDVWHSSQTLGGGCDR
jgi:hypothetical protein